jgi:hypothetical protein
MRIVSFGSLSFGLLDDFRSIFANAIVAALVKEFGFDEALSTQIANAAGKLQLARWIAGNIRNGKASANDVEEMGRYLKTFEQLKPKIKARGGQIDVTKYDYQGLINAVWEGSSGPKTTTEIRSSLPPEIISIISLSLGKAQRLNPKVDLNRIRPMAFQWVDKLYTSQLNVYKNWNKPNFQELAIKKIVEDRREIADALSEYFAFAMDVDYPVGLDEFDTHYSLSEHVDKILTPEQRASKYSIDEPDAGIEGTRVIPLPNGYRAVRIAKWSEGFADKLCKSARWCVRNQKMFEEEYHISEESPLYLLLKGNSQVGLLSLKLAQFKDAQDAPIGDSGLIKKEQLGEVYGAIKALSAAEGVDIPVSGDFFAFMDSFAVDGKLSPRLLLDSEKKLKVMKDENSSAEAEGSRPPHSDSEIDTIEETVTGLKSDYAVQYLKVVSNSNVSGAELEKIMTDIDNFTSRRSSHADITENMIATWSMLGQIAKKMIDYGNTSHSMMTMFRKYSPQEFVSYVRSFTTDTDNHGAYLYLDALEKISSDYSDAPSKSGFVIPEEQKDAILREAYEKILAKPNVANPSHPSDFSVKKDVLAPGKAFLEIPTRTGKKILMDGSRFTLVDVASDSERYRDILNVARLLQWKLHSHWIPKIVETAENLGIEPSMVTPEQARTVYKKFSGRSRWNNSKDDFDPSFDVDDATAQGMFLREVDELLWQMEIRPQLKEILQNMGFAEFTYRLMRWDGDLGSLFGKWIDDEINSAIQSAEATGEPLAVGNQELVRAWLVGHMKARG